MAQKEKKLKPTRNSLTAVDMYNFYQKKYNDRNVNYLIYKEVISRFNKKVSDEILKGGTFNPGYHLGRIRILKVKRKFKKRPPINWAESNKRKKEGVKEYLVYFTDPYWFRWYWEKKKCVVRNKTVYSFLPTVSNSKKDGNRNKLSHILQTDPLAKLRYQT